MQNYILNWKELRAIRKHREMTLTDIAVASTIFSLITFKI